uniref:Sec-independent protein translocase component TatC n=1 Tax=Nitzschia sp. NIES-3576 TaxID=2083273 RepID=A0A2Z5ZAX2_9STRA|nr:Sec-independent protein translocase component TatC [Nitzschia sp. NIES-3576]
MFKFFKKYKKILKISFLEHKKEFFLRLFLTILLIFLIFFYFFSKSKKLVEFLVQINYSKKINFFQNFPSDFFYSALEISIITSLFFLYPILIYQFLLFFFPEFFKKYFYYILFFLIISYTIFNCGIFFSYFLIIPTIVNFFLKYNEKIIVPFWSLRYYVNTVYYFCFIAGIFFQLPLLIFLCNKFNFIIKDFNLNWRYIILSVIIISAIITPTTDFETQIIFSLIFLFLYFFGLLLSFIINYINKF